jgi:chromosome segregation ATPase
VSRLLDRLDTLEAAREEDRAALSAEREARAAEVRELVERHGREVGELRERVGRAEGEAATLKGSVQAGVERAGRLEQERDQARSELDSWTAGGPIARAWRAFAWRRS